MNEPFITYREDVSGKLCYFILQKEFPHYVGLIKESPMGGTLPQMNIPGYSLWIQIVGTVRGSYIPSYQDVETEMNSVAGRMSQWLLDNRILPAESKYRKFKTITNASSGLQ